MATRFTFVPQTRGFTDGRRRMRSRTACESCRNRKRRCIHTSRCPSTRDQSLGSRKSTNANETSDNENARRPKHLTKADDLTSNNRAVPADQDNEAFITTTSRLAASDASSGFPQTDSECHSEGEDPQGQISKQNLPRDPYETPSQPAPPEVIAHGDASDSPLETSPATPRFVSDLNPEARLLDDDDSPEDVQPVSPDAVGIWVRQRTCNRCANPNTRPASAREQDRGIPQRPPPRRSYSLTPISDIVPTATIIALSELYFSKIHPLIPILNELEYRQSLASGTLPWALAHVVCLLAAKDKAAETYLKLLQAGDAPVSVRQFCSRLHTSLVTTLSGRVRLKKLTTIRIMALISLHHEGFDGAEQAAGFNAQAIHRAQSLAMHLRRPKDEGYEMTRIFWCLWTLDRFTAAMHSRPCVMFDRDCSIDPITPEQSGSTAFDILFRIARLLNDVIALYRPTNPVTITGIEEDFVGFEQMVDEAKGWKLAPSTLDTLHVFYLSTAALSHRLKTVNSPPAPTAARLRQQMSAVQIIRSLKDSQHLDLLHPFPIIVYAASLALSISYQQLRYSHMIADQEHALQDFHVACKILQQLRQKWASADVVASLALKISTELNKFSNLDALRVKKSVGQSSTRSCTNCQQSDRQFADSAVGITEVQDLTMCSEDLGPGSEWNTNTSDLFGDMDDISWMYLDAENPVSFDLLPLQDYGLDEAHLAM